MSESNEKKDSVVLNFYNSLLRTSDIGILLGHEWLNDSIIGFFFEYLDVKYKNINNHKLLFISPETTQLLRMSRVFDYVLFLDPLNFRDQDFIFFPLNNCEKINSPGGSHWSLLIYSKPLKRMYHFDSFRNCNKMIAEKLSENINKYLQLDVDVRCFHSENCPQQSNEYDCGLYVLCIAELVSKHVSTFSTVEGCDLNPIDRLVERKRSNLVDLIFALKNKSQVI